MVDATLILSDVVAPALDGQCLNADQARLIFNPTPEVDSLGEWIASLRQYGVPAEQVAHGFALLRTLRESNTREASTHRAVAKAGDDLARAVGAARTGMCARVADHMSVTGVKRALGGADGPLAVLANPAGRSAREVSDARAKVRMVATRAPDAVLHRASLRNQLGASRHDLLLALRAEWGRGGNAS